LEQQRQERVDTLARAIEEGGNESLAGFIVRTLDKEAELLARIERLERGGLPSAEVVARRILRAAIGLLAEEPE